MELLLFESRFSSFYAKNITFLSMKNGCSGRFLSVPKGPSKIDFFFLANRVSATIFQKKPWKRIINKNALLSHFHPFTLIIPVYPGRSNFWVKLADWLPISADFTFVSCLRKSSIRSTTSSWRRFAPLMTLNESLWAVGKYVSPNSISPKPWKIKGGES